MLQSGKLWCFDPKPARTSIFGKGKPRTTHSFTCFLVWATDPTSYDSAQAKGKGVGPQTVKNLTGKFREGLGFSMS